MEDQYGGIPAEFRQLMAVRTEQPQPLISPARPHLGEPFPVHSSYNQQTYGQTSSLGGVGLLDHPFGSGHTQQQHSHFHHRFSASSSATAAINMSGSNGVALYHDLESSSGTGGWMLSSNNMGNYENNMNTTRWPRQETLTSRFDLVLIPGLRILIRKVLSGIKFLGIYIYIYLHYYKCL